MWLGTAFALAFLALFARTESSTCTRSHKIVKGDTCWELGQKHGLSVSEVKALNPGVVCEKLQIGDTLCLAKSSGPKPPPTTPPPSKPPPPSGDINPTEDEFKAGCTVNGYKAPSSSQYKAFVANAGTAGGISSKREAAMALAQFLHESGGLRYKREIACRPGGSSYPCSHYGGGANYYGRGYIQLTHLDNYRKASRALFGDDRLVKTPDLVADDENIAWACSFWYWKTRVGTYSKVKEGYFGWTTKGINGGECTSRVSVAKRRFELYKKVLKAFKVNEIPKEGGCYN